MTSSVWGQSTTTSPAITFVPNRRGGVTVSWQAMAKAAGYRITRFKEDDTCCNSTVDVPATTLSILDAISVPGVYQYTVTAVYRSTITAMSRSLTGPSVQGTYDLIAFDQEALIAQRVDRLSLTVVTACTPMQQIGGPSPPSVQTTRGEYAYSEATAAKVRWDAVNGAVAYKLERAPSGGSNWTDLGCLPSARTSYTDLARYDVPPEATVYPGWRYTYKVTAYQSNGAAGWNSASVTLATMRNPGGLSYTRTGNQVKLCWIGISAPSTPNRYIITSSYGTNFSTSNRCADVYGVPDGTQTFQVGSGYRASGGFLSTSLASRPSITVVISP